MRIKYIRKVGQQRTDERYLCAVQVVLSTIHMQVLEVVLTDWL